MLHIARTFVWAEFPIVVRVLAALTLSHAVLSQAVEIAPSPPQVITQSQLRIVPGLEEPLVPTGVPSNAENIALDAAIAGFRKGTSGQGDFAITAAPFVTFLEGHPDSVWRTAILTNLGIGYYHAGYFTKAASAWEQAWNAGRDTTEPKAKALTDRAVGELARMHARVGHAKELEALFADIGTRPISGPATEMITGAREGLWMFRNEPGKSYLCGPMALRNLLVTVKADPKKINAINDERSGPDGYSLTQVSELADRMGLQHKLIFRKPGQPIPVPSIINWKLNHYAAIVEERKGLYHVQDPTFGNGDIWVSKEAIDHEGSGYFLALNEVTAASGWRMADASEAKQVYGKGFTGVSQNDSTKQKDESLTSPCPGSGMCVANAKLMVVSLNLNDTPVGYRPPKGPAAKITLTYNQREASQPAVFSFFNVSPKWTLNVLSYVQDNPASPGASVMRYAAGGGATNYISPYTYNPTTGAFSPERQGQEVLVRIPATGPATSYELRMPDGSKQVFANRDGATTSPRRIFLTQVVDPAGNALTFHYDAQLRLTSITDATARDTTFTYGDLANPLLVTRITDPFARHADLTYDTSHRLASITDVLGLTSSFTYDTGGLVNAMTTPYGTSHFSYGNATNNTRFLEMTDAMGFTERIEFRHQAPGIPISDPVAPAIAGLDNIYLNYRNTFHWDKHLYPTTHTDYTKARITHWLHNPQSQSSPIIESTKAPLERRVWNTYPGTSTTYFEGTADTPVAVGRVLDDGASQISTFTYNSFGKPLTSIDPLGRKTVMTYAANGIDLLSVQQQTSAGGTLSTIAQYTYNSQHRPLSYTDAAGQVTNLSYNLDGQLTSVTDALVRTTSYTYDGLGRLTTITNPNGQVQDSRTYDAFDRVATITDSEGHTRNLAYDAFDRVTQITYPDGTTTQNTYDKLDLVAVKDRLDRTTNYVYDANRRLTSMTDPLGQVTSYAYYNNGTLRSITDPKGNVTSWDIDIQSRPITKRYANGTTETYTYETTTSRLKNKRDVLAQNKQLGYARDNRVTAITYTNAIKPTPNVSLTYDPYFPRITGMTDGAGTTTFQYAPVGTPGALKLSLDDGPYSNDTVAYQYDALGRVATRIVDSASEENFTYDTLDRVTNHSSLLGSFNLDYLGQTEQMTSQQSGVVGTQWNYETNDSDRRLQSIVNSGIARGFQYDTTPEDLITGITETVSGAPQKTLSYAYDAANRLLGATPSVGAASSYAYDAADNLTSINGATATYNNVNQIASLNGAAYSYDANGNLLDDGVRTYQWDAENRLVKIGYKAKPSMTTTFRYDGMGRRLAIIDTNGIQSIETRYLWCGDTLCQARNTGDVVTRRYFSEGVIIPQGGTMLYYGRDHLGSVRDVMAAQNGSKLASYDYDPYGNVTASSGRISVDFRYAGMFYHQQSGMYLTNYRQYDPRSARWLSRDPIEEQGGLNLYAYVGGNPVNHTDSTGLFIDVIADVGFILYDLYSLVSDGECERNANLAALGLDIAGAIIPGVTGLGAASRASRAAKEVELTAAQLKNIERFTKKLPANAKDSLSLKALPNGSVAAQATSPGRVPGSSAVYEKQIDSLGKTIHYTKTTYDPAGNIVHVKDKIGGGVFK